MPIETHILEELKEKYTIDGFLSIPYLQRKLKVNCVGAKIIIDKIEQEIAKGT